jgi:hypothetical protein
MLPSPCFHRLTNSKPEYDGVAEEISAMQSAKTNGNVSRDDGFRRELSGVK